MTMGYFSVAPKWRKSAVGKLVAETQCAMAYKRFLESDVDALIAFARNDRKVNDMGYMYGSRCLKADHQAHNVQVDVLYTLKNEVRNNPDPLIRKTIDRLWMERTIYSDEFIRSLQKRAA